MCLQPRKNSSGTVWPFYKGGIREKTFRAPKRQVSIVMQIKAARSALRTEQRLGAACEVGLGRGNMASGHVRFRGQSGHDLLHCTCLLLTQGGHSTTSSTPNKNGKVVCMEQSSLCGEGSFFHPNEYEFRFQNVAFDDTATSAMGEASDRACKSLQQFGSAPEIVANRIIASAKNGERDVARLYEQVLRAFGIEEKPMAFVSVGSDLPVLAYASVTHKT